MRQVSVEEAKTNLHDLVDAAVNGEEVVIARDGERLVKLMPIPRANPRPQFGSARGLIAMSEDFEEPLEEFEEYM
jgi:prevent-host-death family protein